MGGKMIYRKKIVSNEAYNYCDINYIECLKCVIYNGIFTINILLFNNQNKGILPSSMNLLFND